jgi:isopentenyl-diphosphate delta-isomerase
MTGTMEKMEAHRQGVLHRAFSIYLFNENNMLLLQKRATSKYHSGGLWTNTCCGHPRPGELIEVAAIRRLQEEMGLSASLEMILRFPYKVQLDKGMTEHELLHVFIGKTENEPAINPEEVEEWEFVPSNKIQNALQQHPENYTEWFKITWPRIHEMIS